VTGSWLDPFAIKIKHSSPHLLPQTMSQTAEVAKADNNVLLPGMIDRSVLRDSEVFWRDHQKWLQDCGYMLRPRYMPDWKASWLNENGQMVKKGKMVIEYEDAQFLKRGRTIGDATRISDGTYVTFKIVKQSDHPHEDNIATFLSSKALAKDPHNHCVPIYETLKVPDDDDRIILVMPFLRSWDNPHLETVGEAVDLFGQLFEGLQFMHKHHVAHRDISILNVMMDGSMYPNSWHPCDDDMDRFDFSVEAKYYTRSERLPSYYLIDFGLSRRYDPKDGLLLELAIFGGDKSVPEFQKSVDPCNPFPTDIYYAGNFIWVGVMKHYKGLEFMQPLVADMVQDDPAKRPSPLARSLPASTSCVRRWGLLSFSHALLVERMDSVYFAILRIYLQVSNILCKGSLLFPLTDLFFSLTSLMYRTLSAL